MFLVRFIPEEIEGEPMKILLLISGLFLSSCAIELPYETTAGYVTHQPVMEHSYERGD